MDEHVAMETCVHEKEDEDIMFWAFGTSKRPQTSKETENPTFKGHFYCNACNFFLFM